MRIPSPGIGRPAGSVFPAPGKFRSAPQVRPIQRLPVGLYSQPVVSVPLVGGQAQGKISATGALTLSIGPQGLGNVWYPASLTVQTTSGTSDGSTANVYAGPAGVGVTLLGTFYPGTAGAGVASFALPSLTPGQYLIVTWAGGNSGDVATVNVIGTMSSVMP